MGLLKTTIFGGGDATIQVEYNDNNLRITHVIAVITAGQFRARVWKSGNLVFDQVFGPGSYSENVAGNTQVVFIDDPDFPPGYYDLPPEITFQFERFS